VENLEMNGTPFAGSVDEIAGDYYAALGIQPALGRFITLEDIGMDHFTPSPVAVIGYRVWRERYHGDPAVLGKVFLLNGKPFTIIGVHPESFSGLIRETDADATVPITTYVGNAKRLYDRRNANYTVIGRLRDGASSGKARAEIEALWPSIRRATAPESSQERESFLARRIRTEPATRGFSYLRERFRRPLYVLLGAVGLLLLLACANLSSIALARATNRTAEFRIRAALGASRWRLVRASLLESLLLALGGAIPGLIFAYWASSHIAQFMWKGNVPLALTVAPDTSVMVFTIAVALIASLLFGLIPAWRAGGHDTGSPIQHANARIVGGLGLAGRALVVVQFALSFAIVSGALLFSRSTGNILHHNPGFNTEHLLIMQLFPRSTYGGFDKPVYFQQLLSALRSTPGVIAASFAHDRPVGLPWKQTILPADVSATHHLVAPGFFDTLGIRILRGRDFDLRDDESRPYVAIVSARLAHMISPAQDAIGQSLSIGEFKGKFEIVGIASDATLDDPRSPDAPAIYIPAFQRVSSLGWEYAIVRTRTNPSGVAAALRQRIEQMGRQYVLRIETADEEYARALLPERVLTLLIGLFGAVALMLAAIGVYGLLSSTIARRTREIGVRMALGATSLSVGVLVLREVAVLLGAGLVGGLIIAAAAARSISTFLYGLSGYDPVSLALTAGVVVIVAGFGSFIPASRAIRMDPAVALREE
jgi:predicted permease